MENTLKIDDILSVIGSLARSQGFYGRLLNRLLDIKNNDDCTWNDVVDELEGQGFKDSLDVIFYFEC